MISSNDLLFLTYKNSFFVICVLTLPFAKLNPERRDTINTLFLVGRLTRDPELKKSDNKSNCFITVAVKRPYKNVDGIYETDFISCKVWNVIAERICEFCKKGDMISVKARIQNNNYTDEFENKVYSYDIIAEQISFMQAQKLKNEDGTESESEEMINAE